MAGFPGSECAADEEAGTRRDPADLHCHSLVVSNRPVLDHETVFDALEVRLSHGKGLAGRHECSLDFVVRCPYDEVSGVPARHRAVRDDDVVLCGAALGRPDEIGESVAQPLAARVERTRTAATGGWRHVGSSFHVHHWASNGWLRDDITIDQAIDTVWALNSPQPRWLLLDHGWSEEHYTLWLARLIRHAIFTDDRNG